MGLATCLNPCSVCLMRRCMQEVDELYIHLCSSDHEINTLENYILLLFFLWKLLLYKICVYFFFSSFFLFFFLLLFLVSVFLVRESTV